MIAEKHELYFIVLLWMCANRAASSFVFEQPVRQANPIAASLHGLRHGVGDKHQHDAFCFPLINTQ